MLSPRWLWLKPNPTAPGFLRETEITIIIACWTQPGPGHSEYMILQCWVIPAKDISSACNWFVHIYKNPFGNLSNDARALHLVQPEPFSLIWTCELDTSTHAGEVPGSCCSRAGRGDHRVTGRVIAAGVRLLRLLFQPMPTECVQQSAPLIWYAFQKPPMHLWILCVCGLIIIVTVVIPFSSLCLQEHMPFLSLFFSFSVFKKK
jgi:hypothetical protein